VTPSSSVPRDLVKHRVPFHGDFRIVEGRVFLHDLARAQTASAAMHQMDGAAEFGEIRRFFGPAVSAAAHDDDRLCLRKRFNAPSQTATRGDAVVLEAVLRNPGRGNWPAPPVATMTGKAPSTDCPSPAVSTKGCRPSSELDDVVGDDCACRS